jgi:dephospho-CoA kinase
MLTIGLTGPSGAGKGVVSAILAEYGVPSIDTDAVYHELLVPPSACLDELAARFGASILNEDGTLNRKALAALVFSPGREAELADLNRIAHRHILAETRRRLWIFEQEGRRAAAVDAPQLFESGFDAECDRILAVLAPYEARLARVLRRDGITEAQAVARLNAAHPDAFFRERADAILWNEGEIGELDGEIRELLSAWEVLP